MAESEMSVERPRGNGIHPSLLRVAEAVAVATVLAAIGFAVKHEVRLALVEREQASAAAILQEVRTDIKTLLGQEPQRSRKGGH